MINPIIAGTNDSFPISSDCSSAGRSKLKNDAEIITPAANPPIAFLSLSSISPLRKNTQAAPSVVPKNGIKIPSIISIDINFISI